MVVAGAALVFALGEVYIGCIYKGFLVSHPDYDFDMGIARTWLANGSFFHPRQLSGPYDWGWGDVLYPPVALWFFVPFSFLPAISWWAVPAAAVAAALRKLRPAPWAWAVMALLLCEPIAVIEVFSGNTITWFVALNFAAVAWGFRASLALLKPSLFPFALFGIHRGHWWLGAGLIVLLSLPFLPLTVTWVRVVLDVRGRGGLLYNADEFAYALIPLVAWAGSKQRRLNPSMARVRQLVEIVRPNHPAPLVGDPPLR